MWLKRSTPSDLVIGRGGGMLVRRWSAWAAATGLALGVEAIISFIIIFFLAPAVISGRCVDVARLAIKDRWPASRASGGRRAR